WTYVVLALVTHGRAGDFNEDQESVPLSMSALMSSTLQTVTRGPSFTGLGNRPSLTPSHQRDFLTGMSGGTGGSAFGSPRIWGSLKSPVSGKRRISHSSRIGLRKGYGERTRRCKDIRRTNGRSNVPPFRMISGRP